MALAEMIIKIGAEITDLEKKSEQAKKSLRGIKEAGEDLERAGRSLATAVTLPIMGIVTASLLAAAQADEGVKRQLDSMKNTVNQTFVNIGRAILPSIVTIFNALQPFLTLINYIINAFASLPQPLQTSIVAFVLLAAAIGPVMMLVGKMLTLYSTLVPVITMATAIKGTAATVSVGLAGAEGAATVATYGLGAAVNFLLGPVGILIGALTLLIGVLGIFNQQSSTTISNMGSLNSGAKWNPQLGGYEWESEPEPIETYANIPRFGDGGVIDRPTLALLGERGEREYVIPESQMPSILMPSTQMPGNFTINIPLYLDGKVIARSILPVTADMLRQKSGVRM